MEDLVSKKVLLVFVDVAKARVKSYTKKDGTVVKEHTDRRKDGKQMAMVFAANNEYASKPMYGGGSAANAKSLHEDAAKDHESSARRHSRGGNEAQAKAHRAARDAHRTAAKHAESGNDEYHEAHSTARQASAYANRIG